MLTVLSISIAITVLLNYAVNPRRGVLLYLAAALFAPTIVFDSFSFRIELLLPLAMLLIDSMSGRTGVGDTGWWRSPVIKSYGAWWVWVMIATLFVYPNGVSTTASWIEVYSLFRPILVMAVFQTSFANADARVTVQEGGTRRVLRLIVFAAIPLGLLAIAQTLDFGPFRDITNLAYFSASRQVVGAAQTASESLGYAWRAVAVFENVSYAATYFVAAAGIGVMMLMFERGRSRRSYRMLLLLAIAAAIVGGMFTMSATFLAGITLVMAAVCLMSPSGNWRRVTLLGVVILSFAGLAGYAVFTGTSNLAAATRYIILTKILAGAGFADRYGGQDTSVPIFAAIQSALKRPIVGWGVVHPIDIIVNDSLYVYLAYTGGLIGILLFCMFLRQQFILSRRFIPEVRAISRIFMMIVLFCGLGSITMSIPRFCDCWWGFTGAMAGLVCAGKSKASDAAGRFRQNRKEACRAVPDRVHPRVTCAVTDP